MEWKCERCGREFRRRGQLHSCISKDLEQAFSGIGLKWLPFYRRMLAMAKDRLPPFTEHFPAVGVQWRGSSTFAEFRYTRKGFFAFFFFEKLRMEVHPVKHFLMSTNRIAHQVEVTERNMDQVIEWIADSYFITQRGT